MHQRRVHGEHLRVAREQLQTPFVAACERSSAGAFPGMFMFIGIPGGFPFTGGFGIRFGLHRATSTTGHSFAASSSGSSSAAAAAASRVEPGIVLE